jgi:hypothetical protein
MIGENDRTEPAAQYGRRRKIGSAASHYPALDRWLTAPNRSGLESLPHLPNAESELGVGIPAPAGSGFSSLRLG